MGRKTQVEVSNNTVNGYTFKKAVCLTAISRRFEKVFVSEPLLTNKAVMLGQRTRSNGDGLANHRRRVAVVKGESVCGQRYVIWLH